MALHLQGGSGTASNTDSDKFLAEHTDVAVGRDALDKAQASVEGGNTFSVINKPISNIVMVQEFNADTNERLFAVALVNDEKAEEYYRKNNQDGDESGSVQKRCCGRNSPRCDRAEDEGPSHLLFERASGCYQFCGRGPDCTADARCPRCAYVGGNCQWQLRCRSRTEL